MQVWYSSWTRTIASVWERRVRSWCECWLKTSCVTPSSSFSPTNRYANCLGFSFTLLYLTLHIEQVYAKKNKLFLHILDGFPLRSFPIISNAHFFRIQLTIKFILQVVWIDYSFPSSIRIKLVGPAQRNERCRSDGQTRSPHAQKSILVHSGKKFRFPSIPYKKCFNLGKAGAIFTCNFDKPEELLFKVKVIWHILRQKQSGVELLQVQECLNLEKSDFKSMTPW